MTLRERRENDNTKRRRREGRRSRGDNIVLLPTTWRGRAQAICSDAARTRANECGDGGHKQNNRVWAEREETKREDRGEEGRGGNETFVRQVEIHSAEAGGVKHALDTLDWRLACPNCQLSLKVKVKVGSWLSAFRFSLVPDAL